MVAARYRPITKSEVKEDGTTLLFNEAAFREMEIDKGDGDVIRA